MFTGLVEGMGRVVATEQTDQGTHLTIDLGELAHGVVEGESIAINGCCLTATRCAASRIGFDLLQETLLRTNLGEMKAGRLVNLERAMPANGRYGGHFVTGHIDATGMIEKWEQVGSDYELRIGITRAQGAYLVPKGCITVDGISLTVAEVGATSFSVWIIPHTRKMTALHDRTVGGRVNLEFDLLAKYTEKILATREQTR